MQGGGRQRLWSSLLLLRRAGNHLSASSDFVYKACSCAEITLPSTADTVILFPLLSARTQGHALSASVLGLLHVALNQSVGYLTTSQ